MSAIRITLSDDWKNIMLDAPELQNIVGHLNYYLLKSLLRLKKQRGERSIGKAARDVESLVGFLMSGDGVGRNRIESVLLAVFDLLSDGVQFSLETLAAHFY